MQRRNTTTASALRPSFRFHAEPARPWWPAAGAGLLCALLAGCAAPPPAAAVPAPPAPAATPAVPPAPPGHAGHHGPSRPARHAGGRCRPAFRRGRTGRLRGVDRGLSPGSPAGRHPPRGGRRRPGRRAVAAPGDRTRPLTARIHAHALGLPGQRRLAHAHPARPRRAGRAARRPGLGGRALWRARRGHHRHLGHGKQLRIEFRHLPHRRCARHAGLRGPPPRLGARRTAGRAAHHRPGRHRRRPHDRLLGRRHGPHPVPAVRVPGLCSGRRWRRPPRHLGQRPGRRRIHGELPVAHGLAAGPALGRGSAPAAGLRLRARGTGRAPPVHPVGGRRRAGHRWPAPARAGRRIHPRARGRAARPSWWGRISG